MQQLSENIIRNLCCVADNEQHRGQQNDEAHIDAKHLQIFQQIGNVYRIEVVCRNHGKPQCQQNRTGDVSDNPALDPVGESGTDKGEESCSNNGNKQKIPAF